MEVDRSQIKAVKDQTETIMCPREAIKRQTECQTETVRGLLRFNIALSFGNDDPLIIASEKGYTEIVTILLQHTRHNTFAIDRSLEAAVRGNYVSCTRAIVDFQVGGHIDRLTLCSRTIASHISYKSEGMRAYPLSLGVHPDTRYAQSDATLLYMAAARGDYNGVETLIAYGADICLERGGHGTALHAAVEGAGKELRSCFFRLARMSTCSVRTLEPL